MLESAKKKILAFLTKLCKERQSVLISPIDLLNNLSNIKISQEELEKKVIELSNEGYFDLVYSDRRGEKVYCITLLEKGKSYFRKERIERQNLVKRLFLTIGFAVVSFLVGVILKKIF